MRKYKHERAATEFERYAGSITGGAPDEVSMARRSFLVRIARWSGALAVFGLGAEACMQTVSRRSIMSSAGAAGALRNRHFHPFPSDDPFNMPIGVNAWYAPISDPATSEVRNFTGGMIVNNGWSHPIYFPTTSDPLIEVYDERTTNANIQSYRSDENGLACCLYQHLMLDATPAQGSGWPDVWGDWCLHIIRGNDVVEIFKMRWQNDDPSTKRIRSTRIVRNRLDHYSYNYHPNPTGPNPLAGRSGVRVASTSALAGLVRIQDVDPRFTNNPHIPHAIAAAASRTAQFGVPGQGSPDNPLNSVSRMFPASTATYHPDASTANCRIGMKFAMDPTIVTDAYLAAIPNKYTRAVVRALRDYGMYFVEGNRSRTSLYGEQGIDQNIVPALQAWDQAHPSDGVPMIRHMRRVAGAGPVHNPLESHWQTWANNKEGWGGGPPIVPYSPPLAPLTPAASPDAPGSIQVTESRRLGTLRSESSS